MWAVQPVISMGGDTSVAMSRARAPNASAAGPGPIAGSLPEPGRVGPRFSAPGVPSSPPGATAGALGVFPRGGAPAAWGS